MFVESTLCPLLLKVINTEGYFLGLEMSPNASLSFQCFFVVLLVLFRFFLNWGGGGTVTLNLTISILFEVLSKRHPLQYSTYENIRTK